MKFSSSCSKMKIEGHDQYGMGSRVVRGGQMESEVESLDRSRNREIEKAKGKVVDRRSGKGRE